MPQRSAGRRKRDPDVAIILVDVVNAFLDLPETDHVETLTRLKEMFPEEFSAVAKLRPPAASKAWIRPFPDRPADLSYILKGLKMAPLPKSTR